MTYISDDVIEGVRQHYDIYELIASYIDLKKTGRNFVGLCPFHPEKTPSFTVSPEKQIFHCFGCQTGGNLFSFIMQMEGMSFPEAVKFLAEKAGMRVDDRPETPEESKRKKLRESLLQMHRRAMSYYQGSLWEGSQGKKVLKYLRDRGLQEKTMQEFGLGFAPDGWENLLAVFKKEGYNLELALQAGLLSQKTPGHYFDYFRHRLIFPIQDRRGQVIAFGGRSLDDNEPKYLNSPESALFNKRNVLYGLNLALPSIRRLKEALVVEGYMDVILLRQHQVEHAVAPLGTSLTENQVALLRGRLETITLAFDADSGGQQASLRGLELLKNESIHARVAVLPENMDPADYVQQFGGQAFQENILEKALPLLEYRLFMLKKIYDLRREEGRVNYWKSARKVLATLSEPVEKETYLKKIAEEINVPLEVLRGDLEKIIAGQRKADSGQKVKRSSSSNPSVSPREVAEKELLACLMREPTYAATAFERLGPDDFSQGPYREVAVAMVNRVREGQEIAPAALLGCFSEPDMQSIIMQLALPELQGDHWHTEKTVRDCIRKIKSLRWSEERDRLIRLLKNETNREKTSEMLRRIRDLRKWEDELKRPGEGEDFGG